MFDYSSVTALQRCDELIEGFRDPDILTQSLERFSPPTNFWKRYRAKLAKSATVTVIKRATCLRLSGHRAVTVLECASAGDVRDAIAAARGDNKNVVLMRVKSGGQSRFVAVPLAKG